MTNPHPQITDAASYKAFLVEQAEDQVKRMEDKAQRCAEHLDGALDALSGAKDELARVRASNPEWVEPTEHVQAHVQ
jgi:hypothetical protein